jgi:hypothetical protein
VGGVHRNELGSLAGENPISKFVTKGSLSILGFSKFVTRVRRHFGIFKIRYEGFVGGFLVIFRKNSLPLLPNFHGLFQVRPFSSSCSLQKIHFLPNF